jgi:hypothetical protein
MENEEDLPFCSLDLDIQDVDVLYRSVCFHLDKWPGGHPEEQERLFAMKDFLYRMILEYKFQID